MVKSLNIRAGKAVSESVDITTSPSSMPTLLVCNFYDPLACWVIMLFAKLDMYTAKLYPTILKTGGSHALLLMRVELVGGGRRRNVFSICSL